MKEYKNKDHNEKQETDTLSNLETELNKVSRELEEEKNRHLRTRADFDNFRRRIERDAETNRIYAKKDILVDLLTFLDYFEQAQKQVRDPAAARGIEIMSRQFNELLHKHGVRPVECLGKPFDPEEQEGIGYMETGQCPEGCVSEEVCSGYKLGDILLKPAQVIVARKPSEENNEQ